MLTEIGDLPATSGVYFFYDDQDRIIYIGKSIHIRKRVQQHFTGKDRKSLKIQTFTQRIAFEETGSELIALLYESDLIKKHQPLYNRSQRRTIFQYGLYLTDKDGYQALRIEKITPGKEEITSFTSLREAKQALFQITEKYQLCQKINGLYKSSSYCFQYHIKSCNGACMQEEAPDPYNTRVNTFLSNIRFPKFTRLFKVPGRTPNEIGLVSMENGIYKGFGFCPVDTPEGKRDSYITPRQDNKDVRRILMRHLIREGY